MPQFTDAKGRAWTLALTYGDLRSIRTGTGFDLDKALRTEGGLGDLLFAEPGTLVEVLWRLVTDQARAAGVDADEFCYGFDGPALERAAEALCGAVADFFPRSRIGKAIRENLPKLLEAMDDRVTADLTRRVTGILSGTAAGSPASSGSTPAPGPSAS